MLFIWLNQFAFCCMSWRWKNVNRPSMEKRCDLKASFLKLGKEKLICLVYGLTKGLLQKLKSVEIIDIHAKKIVVLIFFELKLPIKNHKSCSQKKLLWIFRIIINFTPLIFFCSVWSYKWPRNLLRFLSLNWTKVRTYLSDVTRISIYLYVQILGRATS